MDDFDEEMRQKNEALRKHVNNAAHHMADQVAGAFMLPWPRRPVGKHAGTKSGPSRSAKFGRGGRSSSRKPFGK